MGLIGGAFAQLVPGSAIMRRFGAGSSYSVLIAALAGLPLLVDDAQALPLPALAGLARKGLSAGAAQSVLDYGNARRPAPWLRRRGRGAARGGAAAELRRLVEAR